MQVDDGGEDHERGEQVHDVGQILAVKGFPQRVLLVRPCEQEMEERNNCAFELGTPSGVDCSGGERFPDDGLANVRGDEQRDSTAQSISFLQ